MVPVKCKGCGKEVSAGALICPGCGEKLKKPSSSSLLSIMVAGQVLAVVVLVLFARYGPSVKPRDKSQPVASVKSPASAPGSADIRSTAPDSAKTR